MIANHHIQQPATMRCLVVSIVALCNARAPHAWLLDPFSSQRRPCQQKLNEPTRLLGSATFHEQSLEAEIQESTEETAVGTARYHSSHPEPTMLSRRRAVGHVLTSSLVLGMVSPARATDPTTFSTSEAKVTHRIYLDIAGLPHEDSNDDKTSTAAPATSTTTRRVTIGLFGEQAPDATEKIRRLTSLQGLAIPCRPKPIRDLQREQLQANAVYKRCIESQGQGVGWKDSTIWRIVPHQRVDVGAVSGKFLARQFPDWTDSNALRHDAVGVVSVRRGNQGGFGFTISLSSNPRVTAELDELNVVVGRVLDGWDVLQELNQVPVVKAATVNYIALTGGSSNKDAPSRSCTYGGPLYCNENKPLVKLTVSDCGALQ